MPTIYKKKIKWKPLSDVQKALQVYTKGVEYALVSDDNWQCHSFVWCKDFLHDVVYSSINKKPFEVYRFRYNPLKEPNPSIKKLKILVTNAKDKNLETKLPDCLDFIHQIEKFLKIKPTIIKKCSNPPFGYEKSGVFLFVAHKRWINSPPMLSLYSLFIRIGLSHEIGENFLNTLEKIKLEVIKPYQKYDKKWILEIQNALNKIFKYSDKKIFFKNIKENYPDNLSMDTVHNRLGIIGYSNNIKLKKQNLPVVIPGWHKL
jgi:hypothetical protein